MKDKISIVKKDIVKITVLAVIFMMFFFAGFFLNRNITINIITTNSSSTIVILQTVGIWVGSLGTVAAIVFVVINTNRQIKNQNKESHRPYISISSLSDITSHDPITYEKTYNPYYEVKTYNIIKNQILDNINAKIVFTIKNMGYGIARDIRIYSLDSDKDSIKHKFRQTESVSSVTMLDIINGKSKKILFDIHYHCKQYKHFGKVTNGKVKSVFDYNSRDYCNFVLFYSDLNDNIYSTVFSLSFNCHGPFQYGYYTEGTSNFNKLIKDLPVDYKLLKQKYLHRKNDI